VRRRAAEGRRTGAPAEERHTPAAPLAAGRLPEAAGRTRRIALGRKAPEIALGHKGPEGVVHPPASHPWVAPLAAVGLHKEARRRLRSQEGRTLQHPRP
jgi:hypothetical protein